MSYIIDPGQSAKYVYTDFEFSVEQLQNNDRLMNKYVGSYQQDVFKFVEANGEIVYKPHESERTYASDYIDAFTINAYY